MSNHVYITYSEITGHKPSEDELNSLLITLNKEATFRHLSMINNFLALFPIDFDKAKYVYIQRFLAVNLLDTDIFEKLSSVVENVSLIDRPIFHRQQILLLMKKILLNASSDGEFNPDKTREAKNIVGKLCLMVNDFTVSAEQEQRTESENPHGGEDTERVFSELLAQMLPIIELENPPEITSAITRTQEYIHLSNNHFPETFDGNTLSVHFESLTGITLERFLQMIVGVYAALITKELDALIENPANFNIGKSTYFSNLNYEKEEIDSFYNLTSIKFEELNSEIENNSLNTALQVQYDFTAFRKHPLFHLSNDILTPVDFTFLTEKVSIGLYYTILNVLQKNNINPESFFRHWGYVFEKYVNNIFTEIYPKLSNRFHPNTFYDTKKEIEAFDGIIEYPNSLIVMEYKGGILNAKAKYGGNVNLLLNEMNEKYGTKSDKSGIRQLSKNIERLFNSNLDNRLKIRNLDFPNIEYVYPVLIVNELSLHFGLANWRLRGWFEKEIKTKNIENTIAVKPLLILTIEDLEMLSGVV